MPGEGAVASTTVISLSVRWMTAAIYYDFQASTTVVRARWVGIVLDGISCCGSEPAIGKVETTSSA